MVFCKCFLFQDLYGIGNATPLEDEVQDCELVSFSEANGRTTIVFRRKWNTCDAENDLAIEEVCIILNF